MTFTSLTGTFDEASMFAIYYSIPLAPRFALRRPQTALQMRHHGVAHNLTTLGFVKSSVDGIVGSRCCRRYEFLTLVPRLCGRKFAKLLVWDSFCQATDISKWFSPALLVPSISCMKRWGSLTRFHDTNLGSTGIWERRDRVRSQFVAPPTFARVFLPFDLPNFITATSYNPPINHILFPRFTISALSTS